jgi:beta-xylosidase
MEATGNRQLATGKQQWVTVLLPLLIVGCSAGASTTAPATAEATEAEATAEATEFVPPEDSFQNPVLRADFPDPGVIKVDGTYYAYATNGSSQHVQLAVSTDLVNWDVKSDAMPALAPWVRLNSSDIWAPEVIEIDGTYVLYYTGRDDESGKQCVGVAVADKPEGKFKDTNDAPLVCQTEQGGTIDPSPFRDADGTLYLYYKNDGNCCSKPTNLYVQALAPDGLSLVGEPVQLVRNDATWEGNVVEAPTMFLHDGDYYLFFSANNYGGHEYAVGYATCETAMGPCEDSPDNPILASRLPEKPLVIGPGHQTIIQDDDGDLWLVYHVWEVLSSGIRGDRRFMYIDPLVFEDGVPDILGPTTGYQPEP